MRVGHKGADGIVAGNTPASFDAALEAGAEMIEFDVLSRRADGSGELLVAHDYGHVRGHSPPTLDEALAHLAGERFAQLRFDVDLKLPGYELRVLEALERAGLRERSMISSGYRASLALIRAADPALPLGWSVPRLRRDYTTDSLTRIPALAAALGYRVAFPRIAARELRAGHCDALMAHWRLVTPRLVRAVRVAGGELYVWTVDDAAQIAALDRLGVTGVITNDPRLFARLQGSEQAAAL